MQELQKRIQDGEIGDIILMRGYRMASGPVGSAFSTRWPGKPERTALADPRFHSFLWASGGCFSDFYIHHIDHLCWMKNAWPVKAQALGGRHYRTCPDGTSCTSTRISIPIPSNTPSTTARNVSWMDAASMALQAIYSSSVTAAKAWAIVSKNGDCGMPSSTSQGQKPQPRQHDLDLARSSADETDPYLNEWNDLIDAIRNDKPYNEVPRGVQASLVTSMGRMAAHTGRKSLRRYAQRRPRIRGWLDKWTNDSPPPVVADKDGKYPVPMPGKTTKHEYEMNVKA